MVSPQTKSRETKLRILKECGKDIMDILTDSSKALIGSIHIQKFKKLKKQIGEIKKSVVDGKMI